LQRITGSAGEEQRFALEDAGVRRERAELAGVRESGASVAELSLGKEGAAQDQPAARFTARPCERFCLRWTPGGKQSARLDGRFIRSPDRLVSHQPAHRQRRRERS